MRYGRDRFFKIFAIYSVALIGVLLVLLAPPIPQDPEYHNFSDQRTIIGFPHFWNVVTSLPFLVVGIIGLITLLHRKSLKYSRSLLKCYLVFYAATCAIGIGSAYYHLHPTNETLVWDRLPMTVTFMAFFSIIIGEYISEKIGKRLFLPLIILGIISVAYWHVTEKAGHGDLRLYALVQYLPLFLIPMILVMFRSRFLRSKYIWIMLGVYVFAKAFEIWDRYMYNLTVFMGGHSIKHVLAALVPLIFIIALKKQDNKRAL